ncbi:MAG: hypothetical protein VKJ05_01360 [Synechococcaceae cyanobacterium]|nr:hypothetical protein [Synechococcaceae cyanobacterium]
MAVTLVNGGFIPSTNLTAASAGINAGTGAGGTVPSIYTIPGWTVVDNPRSVDGWQNNLMYVVSDGNTFSKEGAGLNAAQQNGRRNWTLFGTPGQTVNSVDNSGWYIASDGDPAYSGAIQQLLSGLTVGTTYDVTFWQAAGQFDCYLDGGQCIDGTYNQATTNWWEVSFGGSTQSSQTIAKAANAPVSGWQKQVLSFAASGSTALLEFMANGTPGNQPPMALLSGVTVTPQDGPPNPPNPSSAVPGPLGVLGCGAAFGVSRSLRRRLRARR